MNEFSFEELNSFTLKQIKLLAAYYQVEGRTKDEMIKNIQKKIMDEMIRVTPEKVPGYVQRSVQIQRIYDNNRKE